MSDRRRRRVVLVTGMHRSGTTWVGKTLATASSAVYLHEPFNLDLAAPWLSKPLPEWYFYVNDEVPEREWVRHDLRRLFDLRPPLLGPIAEASGRARLSVARRTSSLWRARGSCRTVVMKDPLAFFSAPFIHDEFSAEVVACVRHPAACVSSLKRLGWSFDIRNWLRQDELIGGPLRPYAELLEATAKNVDPADIVTIGAVVWKVVHGTLLEWRHLFPDWIVVRQEDLARDVITSFASLFERLGLESTVGTRELLHSFTTSAKAESAPEAPVFDLAINSLGTIETWRRRLNQRELEVIEETTRPEFVELYGEGAF